MSDLSDTPAISLPDGAAVEPEMLVRDQLVCCAWALVAAVRTSRLIAADVDAVKVINAALAQTEFGYRLQPLH